MFFFFVLTHLTVLSLSGSRLKTKTLACLEFASSRRGIKEADFLASVDLKKLTRSHCLFLAGVDLKKLTRSHCLCNNTPTAVNFAGARTPPPNLPFLFLPPMSSSVFVL